MDDKKLNGWQVSEWNILVPTIQVSLERLPWKTFKACYVNEKHCFWISMHTFMTMGCISLLLPRLPKFPSQCYSNRPGNFYASQSQCKLVFTRKYYPSSNQFRDPPTYTHQPSMQQKVPFSLIRCSSSKVAFCSCVEWGWHIYNIVESESDPLTRRAVDLFEKEPLKGNSEVYLHTPTKFGEDRSKDLGGDREQTDRQTDKRCSIYSMIPSSWLDVWVSVRHSGLDHRSIVNNSAHFGTCKCQFSQHILWFTIGLIDGQGF